MEAAMSIRRIASFAAIPALVFACSSGDNGPGSGDSGPNPFLQDQSNPGKADSAYLNPDGIEVEVDVEADVTSPAYRVRESPLYVAQFATTFLRERGEFYIESLAEDSTNKDRVEWLVDGQWVKAADAGSVDTAKLTHFRIRGMNAVLLNGARSGVQEGSTFEATVPVDPFNVMSAAGDKCANFDGHISLSQSVYWYLWNPEKSGCSLQTQQMQITVSRMFAESQQTYPEFDQLIADGKVTGVVLFGQIGDGPIDDSETGVRNMKTMANWLMQADFTEVTSPPVGRRFIKHIGQTDFELDLYAPSDFSGLGDYAHFSNLQKAISEHEIIVYDGHSMLGASDFWSKPTYPDFYQIYIYGGCLGYEYYVHPILEGKGGWSKLDLVSSVVEVSADANEIAGPVFAKVAWALDHNYDASWRTLLLGIRNRVGDSTFGASGVRDNCFSPNGSLCGAGGGGGAGGSAGAAGAGGSGAGGSGGAAGSGAAAGSGGLAGAGGSGAAAGSGGGTSGDSCVGQCGQSTPVPGSSPACYCDTACVNYGDCCSDYSSACP
jgi:Somatomedin B domain